MTMLGAIITWVFCVGGLFAVLRFGLLHARSALIAVALILLLQTGFRPVLFFLDLDKPFPQTHFAPTEWDMVTTANLAVLAWTTVLLASYVIFKPLSGVFSKLLPNLPITSIGPQPLGRFAVVLAPFLLTVGGTLYLAMTFGGFPQLIYASKIGKELQGLFVIQEAATLASLLAWFGVITSVGSEGHHAHSNRLVPLFYLAIILAAMGANYAWGNRYNLAILVLIFGFSWHFYVQNLAPAKILVGGATALILLQALKYVRLAAVSAALHHDTPIEASFWLDISTSLHFVEYDALMLALRDAGNLFDFRAGADFAHGLLSWIPRSLLPGKETFNVGPWFRQVYQPGVINGWPVTTIGSWYINFGAIGIGLGAFLSGFVVRVFDTAFCDIRDNPWSAVVGFGLSFLMLEGGVNTGFPQRIVLLIIPLWLAAAWLLLRASNRAPTTPRETWQEEEGA